MSTPQPQGEGNGTGVTGALSAAADAANEGAVYTIGLQALKGRASYLGPRSVGHEDPGAASSALMLRAQSDVAVRLAPSPGQAR